MKLKLIALSFVLLFTNCFTLIGGGAIIWTLSDRWWGTYVEELELIHSDELDNQETLCQEREDRKFWLSYHFVCMDLKFGENDCLNYEQNGYQSGAHNWEEPRTFQWEIIKGNTQETKK
jgi:hypothetical protein